MRIRHWLPAVTLLLMGVGTLAAQEYDDEGALEARVWLDRGEQPLLQRGDRVRIYYRTSADAYVAIFHIDTDGSVQLLHPRSPDDDHFVAGARDYRLLFPQSPYWFVDEYPGKGYFFIVASPQPFDFSAFDYARYERGWDLTRAGRTVYEDPYVAMDDYVAKLIPDWQSVPYALDFIAYDVGETHEYPRFLCYECHGFRSYTAWNPYTYACSSFRVVIWDDPYFYPAYRYRGTKAVFVQPQRGLARYEFKERGRGETWTPLVRTRQPPTRRSVEYREPAVAAPAMPEFVPPRRRATPSDAVRSDGGGARAASPSAGSGPPLRRGAPTVVAPPASTGGERRPSVQPGQATPRTPSSIIRRTDPPRGQPQATPAKPRSGERPVLQRRPTTPAKPQAKPKAKPKRPGGGTESRPSGGASRPSSGRPSGGVSRPSGGRTGVVLPRRPSAGSRPSVGATPNRASPPRTSGARPSARRQPPATQPRRTPKPRKPGGGGSAAARRQPTARKPGGGARAPVRRQPARKPGGKPGGRPGGGDA